MNSTCVTTARLTGPVDAVRTSDGAPFDTDTYSRMKHGDADARWATCSPTRSSSSVRT